MTNFWKKHGAHVIAYVMSLLVTVLGAVVHYGALLGPSAPHHAVLLVGVAGILLTAVHHIQALVSASSTTPSRKQGGRADVRLLALLAASSVAILVGCSTLSGITSNQASASAVQAAIDLAVGTAIQQTAKTASAQSQEAQQIQQIAGDLKGVLNGQSTTLALLDQALRAKIAAAHLGPAQAAGADMLIQTIQAIILQQVQGGTSKLSPTQTVAINTVLDDVIQAASFYNVHAMAEMRADLALNFSPAWRRFSEETAVDAAAAARRTDLQMREDRLAAADPVGVVAARRISRRLATVSAELRHLNGFSQ